MALYPVFCVLKAFALYFFPAQRSSAQALAVGENEGCFAGERRELVKEPVMVFKTPPFHFS